MTAPFSGQPPAAPPPCRPGPMGPHPGGPAGPLLCMHSCTRPLVNRRLRSNPCHVIIHNVQYHFTTHYTSHILYEDQESEPHLIWHQYNMSTITVKSKSKMLQYVLNNLVSVLSSIKKNCFLSLKLMKKCQREEFTDLNRKTPIS